MSKQTVSFSHHAGPTRRHFVVALAAVIAGLNVVPGMAQGTIERETADGARYVVPAEWVVGQPLSVNGTGWTDIAGTAGSTIAVVYDFGSVPSPDPIDDEIWLRVVAGTDGSWSAEVPFPPEAGWAAGEVHKVHFLTGSLGQDDKARGAMVEVTLVAAE